MSKKKKNKNSYKNKSNNNIIGHSGIIHGQNSIYIHTVKSINGKRQHKRSCIYYDVNSEQCNNKRCSKVICTTAHNCTGYKRKEKIIKNKLSDYDETYIQQPYKASIHDSDNRYIGMSRNIGTPVHEEYLKSDGIRRHKTRCIYYDKINKLCKWFMYKCIGSSHCKKYTEKR